MDYTPYMRIKSNSGRFIALLPDTLEDGYIVVVTSIGVEDFGSRWPCHGLYGNPIKFYFDNVGNLVDIEGRHPDNPALSALCEDAQEFGEKMLKKKKKGPNNPKKAAKTTIVQDHSGNFRTLKEAFANGDVALMDCRLKATGEHVAVICCANKEADGEIAFVPFAMLFNGNPYELLVPPSAKSQDEASAE